MGGYSGGDQGEGKRKTLEDNSVTGLERNQFKEE